MLLLCLRLVQERQQRQQAEADASALRQRVAAAEQQADRWRAAGLAAAPAESGLKQLAGQVGSGGSRGAGAGAGMQSRPTSTCVNAHARLCAIPLLYMVGCACQAAALRVATHTGPRNR
jgi:hypothetical protein